MAHEFPSGLVPAATPLGDSGDASARLIAAMGTGHDSARPGTAGAVRRTDLIGPCTRQARASHLMNVCPGGVEHTRNTDIREFSIRPAVPVYCRCTPTDSTPFFRSPVSSMTLTAS